MNKLLTNSGQGFNRILTEVNCNSSGGMKMLVGMLSSLAFLAVYLPSQCNGLIGSGEWSIASQ